MEPDGEAAGGSSPSACELFSEYFCIFCDATFATIHEAYEHYKEHMTSPSYCAYCDWQLEGAKGPPPDEECSVNHEAEEAEFPLEAEVAVIEMWIERFLSYQEEMIDKPHYNLITSTKFFLGCPVCDILIKMCNVTVPVEVLQHRAISLETLPPPPPAPSTSNSDPNSLAKDAVKCHTVRHACAHLRYYPYECYACESVGRYQKKPDISEMMRHIKDGHGKNTKQNLESIVKYVRITKLEKFIEFYLKSRPMVRFDPILPPKPPPLSSRIIFVDPLKIKAQQALVPKMEPDSSQSMPSSPTSPAPDDSEESPSPSLSPPAKTYSRSLIVPNNNSKSTAIAGQSRLRSPPELMLCKLTPSQNNGTKRKSSDFTPVDDDLETPSPQPSRPTPRLTSAKSSNSTSLLSKSAAETKKSDFQRQFGNIFDDEMMKFAVNQEEDLDVEYFCLFCEDKFKEKDEARRHYQRHVNYYPMICSLCGEGATDMPEFLKHHTEAHPDAEKGRYKRREQAHIDKWINGFLYAQATIIRAFPPREQCPVCDKVFSQDQVKAAKPRRCTVNRKIDHVHRHLCYLPYECVRCKDEGKEFLVAYFESKAHSHIKLKHPDIDDKESRWYVFQKTINIPELDDYVSGFLTRFGISMDFERRPVKKQARETFSSPDFLAAYKSNSGQSLGNSILYNQNSSDDQQGSSAQNSEGEALMIMPPQMNQNELALVVGDEDSSRASDDSDPGHDDAENMVMVVAVSPSHAECVSLEDGPGLGNSEYCCIFCPAQFSSKIDAYPHFGEHLEYRPVVCLLCESKFHDIDSFTVHHQIDHLEATDLMYEIREDQNVEKWVDEFLESQQGSASQRLTMSCSCAACCPVCERLRPHSTLALSSCLIHNDVDFSDHIHQHLVYYAYECSLCKKFGRVTRVPNLDAIAMNHVKDHHKIEGASMYQLCRTFPKTQAIPRLEKFISDSVQKKRNIERKWRSHKGEGEHMTLAHHHISTANGVATVRSGGSALANALANNSAVKRVRLTSPQSLISSPAVGQPPSAKNFAHVRVEGGRVVNLPSSLYIRAVQHKQQQLQQKKPNDLIEKPRQQLSMLAMSGSGSGTGSASSGGPAIRYFVKCLHCNLELPNRKQLKTHHLEQHPGLSMACYTTPRAMLPSQGVSQAAS